MYPLQLYMYPLDLYKNFALYWYEKKIKNIISFLPIEKKFGSAGDSKQEFFLGFLGLTLSTTITTGPVYKGAFTYYEIIKMVFFPPPPV